MRSPVELDDVGYLDVPASAVQIGEEERAATLRVLDSGMLAQGPEVARSSPSSPRTSTVGRASRSTRAPARCSLALVALGIGPGDEVVVPSFSFAATANAVALTGARPVFADIEPAHFCLDPSAVEAAVTTRTARDRPGAPLRPSRADGPHRRRRREARARRRRGRRPGPPRRARRAPGRHLRGRGRLQLLPHQEHDLGRGRHGRLRRRGRRTHGAPPAQPGHGTPLRQRDRRLTTCG